jgi:hypothetical protein
VGIGKTNPGVALDVVGNIRGDNLIRGVAEVPIRWNSQNETVFPQSQTTRYYKIATLGSITSAFNGGKLRISGTIGGFGEDDTTLIDAFIASRGGIIFGGTLTGKGASADTTRVDFVVYKEANTFSVWLKLVRFFTFDFTIMGAQVSNNTRTLAVLPCPTTDTSVEIPTGDLEGSVVGACSIVFTSNGNVGIGITNPGSTLHINSTDSIIVPVGTEAQRPDPAQSGMIRFNDQSKNLEFYSGTKWFTLATSGSISSGGIVTEEDGFRIHTFRSSGTFSIQESRDVEYLVVAGGASGGGNVGGGGGAGGLLTGTITLSPADDYDVIVGAGGAASPNSVVGNDGNGSSFGTLISTTGGGGGGNGDNSGRNGGSGGGGGASSGAPTVGGTGITEQGFGGGKGTGSIGTYSAGGGGGAGAVGVDGVQGVAPGDGGVGVSSSISGTATFYAGGGGGGSATATNLSSGGLGGGGSGGRQSPSVVATDAVPNTGGGGGGGAGPSGAGGSGFVIIRYLL